MSRTFAVRRGSALHGADVAVSPAWPGHAALVRRWARRVGVAYLRLLLDRPALARCLGIPGPAEVMGDAERRLSRRIGELRGEFEIWIRAAIEAGEMRATDPRLVSFFLFGAWNGVAALALRDDDVALTPPEIEEAVLRVSAALVRGLKA